MDLFKQEWDDMAFSEASSLMPKHQIEPPTDETYECESWEGFKTRLTNGLKQMMYVSGETAEPSHETTGMVEEIVRQQVIEMVCDSSIYKCHIPPGSYCIRR